MHAHFIHELYQTIGIADGVGGWAKKGIDTEIYARELMRNSLIAMDNEPMKGNLKRVLEEAYKNTNSEGSSMSRIITLNSEKSTIIDANVGDSGFFLIRKEKIIYKLPIQQRGFGCPYQLGNCNADNPSVAQEMELNVEKDDILMVGTDGMLNNIYESEIEEIVRRAIHEKLKAEELACQIGNVALYNSFDRFADTPYARASKGRHKGGTIDDITVI
ncbi:probable protein phosphatase 2C 55 [Solanum dulcamara]|uniref:probable protein phosphatase 2C 55 n=1 Tax=Solanum dulcamara TaxID=45834 RepID=UPI002485759E|nr:probable protein phosphatase 2C 55 [Solanum dulcamara]